jgi:hypothetical protein
MAGKLPVLEREESAFCGGCRQQLAAGIVNRDEDGNLYHRGGLCLSMATYRAAESGDERVKAADPVELKYV